MIDKEHGFIKDRECINCKRFFTCTGKPKDVKQCVSFEQREKDEA